MVNAARQEAEAAKGRVLLGPCLTCSSCIA